MVNAFPAAAAGLLSTATVSFLQRLLPLLSSSLEPHAVGGFLRDALYGRPTRDLDLTVRGDALTVARNLADALKAAYVPLDEQRGIARVVAQHAGQVWRVDLASLQQNHLHDLGRRDFTIDAMSVPLPLLLTGEWQSNIIDPFGGRGDLERRLVRAVGPEVFREDGLRLLRAVRLTASLDFEIEHDTRDMIRRQADALAGVSGERIRDEFLAILETRPAIRHVHLLDDLRLLGQIIPELEEGRGVTQPKEHHWDVFHHNVETVGAVEGLLERKWDPSWVLEAVPWNDSLAAHFQEMVGEGHTRATLLKLAGLIHDIAKPAARTVDSGGRIRFLGHHSEGAIVARVILHRLRFARHTSRMVEAEIEHHLRPGQMSQGTEMATPRAVYRYFRSAGEVAIDTLYLNLADYLAARGPLLERAEWTAYAAQVRHTLDSGLHQEEEASPALRLVDGRDLMASLNLTPGPLVGRLLEAIQEAQSTGEVTTKEEALALASGMLAADPLATAPPISDPVEQTHA